MAVRWLLQSGISISNKSDEHYGAVYSHYRGRHGGHELVYAEATGYMLSLLKLLYRKYSDPAFVEFARASGDWLVRWAERNGGIIAMGLRGGEEIREAYAFDNGVCCKGLADLYELTSDERYLRCAERIADWIVSETLNRDGSIKPVFDIDAAQFTEDRTVWYKISGSFHAKIAMPLLQLYSLNKDKRFDDAAVSICEWALGQQQPNGSFPANKTTRTAYVHFHCYTVEALLYAYTCRRTQRFLDAAEKAIDWALAVQSPGGTLPRWCDVLVRERASDVQAQAVRIFSLMNMLRPRGDIREASRKALQSLLELQGVDQDERVDGGFFEGTARKFHLLVRRSLNMTSWAAMFAVHALYLMQEAPARDFFSESKFLF